MSSQVHWTWYVSGDKVFSIHTWYDLRWHVWGLKPQTMFCRLRSPSCFSGAFSLRKAACYEKPGGEVLLWQVHISQCKKCRGLRYRSSICKVQPRFWKVHKAFFFNVIECGLPWTWIWKYAEQTNPGLVDALALSLRERFEKNSRAFTLQMLATKVVVLATLIPPFSFSPASCQWFIHRFHP